MSNKLVLVFDNILLVKYQQGSVGPRTKQGSDDLSLVNS